MDKRVFVERQIMNLIFDEANQAIYTIHRDVTSTPTIYNVTLTDANTEYSQDLPANCRFFEFQCRTAFAVRYAYVTGKVATPTAPYMTLKSGGSYYTPVISQGASPSTVYFASAQAGVVVEITAWT